MAYEHMMGWGGGHMFGFGLLGWVLVVVVAVVVVLLATRWRIGRAPTDPCGEDRSVAILKERYARGEIDKAEFEARKRDLS
ncbi:hypothetical protein B9Z45_10995 [Limnohabitans sp. 2KL-17]|uniref:SHOCT domain-containing protein n=1 Tax=Limnohabitans sp. 2KL-17 TaxID=1100704 RepID=UPI000DD2265C|nr:SHOCT domain-containing protein [Limnohabitans sp. 2KL-17]PUE55013.1 hypothetical protein B9Z45_10995 [Limnohabitans sp. 2KL-17]